MLTCMLVCSTRSARGVGAPRVQRRGGGCSASPSGWTVGGDGQNRTAHSRFRFIGSSQPRVPFSSSGRAPSRLVFFFLFNSAPFRHPDRQEGKRPAPSECRLFRSRRTTWGGSCLHNPSHRPPLAPNSGTTPALCLPPRSGSSASAGYCGLERLLCKHPCGGGPACCR